MEINGGTRWPPTKFIGPALPTTPSDWYILGAVSRPCSTGYLAGIDILCAFEGVVDCYFGFYISWEIFCLVFVSQFPWGFIERRASQKPRDGFERATPLLLLDELLCQPCHLIGIIQSYVRLSCFTGYFPPGLVKISG